MTKLLNCKDELTPEEYKKKAGWLILNARRFGVHNDIEQLFKVNTPKKASKPPQEEYPIRNYDELVKAAQWFVTYRTRMPYETRRQLAFKLIKAAQKIGPIPNEYREAIEKSAGMGVSTMERIREQIKLRIQLATERGHDKAANQLRKLESAVAKDTEETFYRDGKAVKLASTIDNIDKLVRNKPYKNGLLLAEDFIFAVPKSVVEQQFDLIENVKTGNYYRKDDVKILDPVLLRAYLGDDVIDAIQVVDQIDPDHLNMYLKQASVKEAKLFDRAAKLSGIKPYAVKKPQIE
ncbi:MAG: hypothetical protein KatS3mg087_0072 [Patescibacteria group bacterium]|nr:MAG: hypothetical protein KatS3mg087_0072 [Patescibacteria group bacterium]